MFTGLIQTLGTCRSLSRNTLEIICSQPSAALILTDLALGDSVAVDGVCLTVAAILPAGFVADVSPETLQRSTLGQAVGDRQWVNVEASLRVGSKLGGHFVTGHVDDIGHFQTAQQTATAWEMTFTANDRAARYIVPKGSIAVNGISLTVADCDPLGQWFRVAVIPVTYAETNLSRLQPNSWVNLEGDILGKYVEKFLLGRVPDSTNGRSANRSLEQISPNFLAEHGYL